MHIEYAYPYYCSLIVSPIALSVVVTYCPCLLPTPIACICYQYVDYLCLLPVRIVYKTKVTVSSPKETLQGNRGRTRGCAAPLFFR